MKISKSYKKYGRYIIRSKSGKFIDSVDTWTDAMIAVTFGQGNKVIHANNKHGEKFLYSD